MLVIFLRCVVGMELFQEFNQRGGAFEYVALPQRLHIWSVFVDEVSGHAGTLPATLANQLWLARRIASLIFRTRSRSRIWRVSSFTLTCCWPVATRNRKPWAATPAAIRSLGKPTGRLPS